tara:strand:+ start:9139 stop:9312 length:174 start_codon:yes stop_codon:yes gene_type:complete
MACCTRTTAATQSIYFHFIAKLSEKVGKSIHTILSYLTGSIRYYYLHKKRLTSVNEV